LGFPAEAFQAQRRLFHHGAMGIAQAPAQQGQAAAIAPAPATLHRLQPIRQGALAQQR